MNITPGLYPQFSTVTTLEELTLQLCRKVLEVQNNPDLNTTNERVITITENITEEIATIELTDLQGTIQDGTISVKDYFNFDFTPGTGVYPYDRETLLDALFHVLAYQHKQELVIAKNPGSKMCCDFSIESVTEMSTSQQLLISCSLTDYPITINGNSRIAKPYLI